MAEARGQPAPDIMAQYQALAKRLDSAKQKSAFEEGRLSDARAGLQRALGALKALGAKGAKPSDLVANARMLAQRAHTEAAAALSGLEADTEAAERALAQAGTSA